MAENFKTNQKKSIGDIGNDKGALYVLTDHDNKFYWTILPLDGDFYLKDNWEQIPKSLYDELIRFNENQ